MDFLDKLSLAGWFPSLRLTMLKMQCRFVRHSLKADCL